MEQPGKDQQRRDVHPAQRGEGSAEDAALPGFREEIQHELYNAQHAYGIREA
ncbi:hypothetical protein D3C75_1375040 [compost metagenome]